MRCKKHITDFSSAVGVCSSCLRERLFIVMAAQAQENLKRTNFKNDDDEGRTPDQLIFPRSVSPYISRRKSDILSGAHQEILLQRFFSTPHIEPSGKIIPEIGNQKKKHSKFGFSFFGNFFFSSKSKKSDSDIPGRDSITDSRSWLKTMSLGRGNKKTNDLLIKGETTTTISRKADKGISPPPPERSSIEEEDDNWMNNGFSGSLSSECSKQTPKRTPAWILPGKKLGGHGHGRNGSGFGFCLSPLIKASTSRNWNQKGFPSE